MKIEIDSCNDIKTQLNEFTREIKKAHDTEWNDSVHESFHGYIDESSSIVGDAYNVVELLSEVKNDLEEIDIDGLQERLDALKEN